MAEVEAKKVVLKNLAGEYLVPITEPYIAGEGIKIEDNVISADIGEISSLSMPSDKYIDLTLGASGTTYIAPADGWYSVSKNSGVKDSFMYMTSNGVNIVSHANSAAENLEIYIPVSKGSSLYIGYSATGVTKHFRFVYAKGWA